MTIYFGQNMDTFFDGFGFRDAQARFWGMRNQIGIIPASEYNYVVPPPFIAAMGKEESVRPNFGYPTADENIYLRQYKMCVPLRSLEEVAATRSLTLEDILSEDAIWGLEYPSEPVVVVNPIWRERQTTRQATSIYAIVLQEDERIQ